MTRNKGRIPDLRCKCEVGVRQQLELTFTLPKNSVSFCTAARRLGAHFHRSAVVLLMTALLGQTKTATNYFGCRPDRLDYLAYLVGFI